MNSVEAAETSAWTWWQRGLFRFAFVFWGWFCLERGVVWQVTWFVPWLNKWVLSWPLLVLSWPSSRLAAWFAARVFHLSGQAATRHRTGSGDTALDYVGILALLVFAVLGAVVWTAIAEWGTARRGWRREYRTLYAWLRLAVRFTLASVLLGYGFSKVFDLQFSPPGSRVLSERYGDSSPMALLWTFMGSSVPYTIFGGLAEVVPGVLLLFHRTSTVGALSAAAVMVNVVMLNFCYDVPVKLFSTLYLLMAVFLLLPDFAPMWRFFLGRREAVLTGVWVPQWERKPLRIASYCVQALVVGHLVVAGIAGGYSQWSERAVGGGPAAMKDGVDGTWSVESSTGWPDGQQWKTVIIGSMRASGVDYVGVTQADGKQWEFSETMDFAHAIHFLKKQGSDLRWTQDASGKVTLEGTWEGKPARLVMHREAEEFPLTTRGFHWVQEMPFNR